MENDNPIPVAATEPARPGMLGLLGMIFSAPVRAFPFLNRKTDWLIPLILMAVLGGLIGHLVRPIYARDMQPQVIKNMERYRATMSEEQYNQVMTQVTQGFEEAARNPFKWYYVLTIFLYPFVVTVIISAIGLLAGNFMYGGKANFWIVMNVVAFAALIGLLGDIARGIMVLTKDSMFVYSGLGLLKPHDDGSFLFYLFRQIDLFALWRIAVTALGLGVIYKMKPKRFGYVLFPVWLLFITVVSVANIFTGGTIIY